MAKTQTLYRLTILYRDYVGKDHFSLDEPGQYFRGYSESFKQAINIARYNEAVVAVVLWNTVTQVILKRKHLIQ